jgi:hypothetical protein
MDGTTDTIVEEGGGMIDNLTFVHPTLDNLALHYKFESMYEDGSIDYVFVREFNSKDLDSYVQERIHAIHEEGFETND